MTRFLSDQFPALYPSIVSHCRAGGEGGELVGWVVLGMLQKDGNAREEGENTARWIYIGVDHNCLSQISFICFCLWKLLLLSRHLFTLKIIRMQTDHCGYSVCFSISS